MWNRTNNYIIMLLCLIFPISVQGEMKNWKLDLFMRIDSVNPLINPQSDTQFYCPIQKTKINWETGHTFNPAAVVHNNKVYLIYRAEDESGKGIGYHTSRLGVAVSFDGFRFQRAALPIFYPDNDDQYEFEFPGGCEDPRIVEAEDGTFVMTYTQWNRQLAVIGIATSKDLLHWKKHGYAFDKHIGRVWSKSGAIVCRREGDKLIATKIQGKYWMYWGEGHLNIAVSDNLINWEPLKDSNGEFLAVFSPREGKFDSELVEAGPPPVITKKGILMLYNGKNHEHTGDPKITPRAYSAGQILFDLEDPRKVIARSEDCFLTPEKSFEMFGQYPGGTVFIEGLVHFKGKWLLYYGGADSTIGVAVSFSHVN